MGWGVYRQGEGDDGGYVDADPGEVRGLDVLRVPDEWLRIRAGKELEKSPPMRSVRSRQARPRRRR